MAVHRTINLTSPTALDSPQEHPHHTQSRPQKRLSKSRTARTLLICLIITLIINCFYYSSVLQGFERHHIHHALIVPLHRPLVSADYRLAELQCDKYGGPALSDAQEMVYWQDIESDAKFASPFNRDTEEQYLTFEPDEGGFNNMRMAMETVLALAHAMGRTLVLPPEQQVYLLNADSTNTTRTSKRVFSFADFFAMDRLATHQAGLPIISTHEFLKRQQQLGRQDLLLNRIQWDGASSSEIIHDYEPWLRQSFVVPEWDPERCLAAFPSTTNPSDAEALQRVMDEMIAAQGKSVGTMPPRHRPTPVYATVRERLEENANGRKQLCLYNSNLASEPVIHFGGKQKNGVRLLVPFYGFLFFQNWKQDTWTKRFIRDHVVYVDEIQCAAARIVKAIRQHARERDPFNINGEFDAFHVRRGEFQYKRTRVDAAEIYELSRQEIKDGTTVYVATDEKKKQAFFYDMAVHYDLVYLDDYMHLITDVNPNFYGMIDQLVASRSRVFFGCWFSTFTSYINRIRGYHADRLKLPGFATGIIESYYYALPEHKYKMKEYWPLTGAFHSREFPVSWRNIDQGIDAMDSLDQSKQ